jgi:hypothetical protein
MFRSTKRKPKVRKVIRTSQDDDDDDDDNHNVVKNLATNNRHDQDDDQNENNNESSSSSLLYSVQQRKKKLSKQKKKTGGGLVVRSSFDAKDDDDDEEESSSIKRIKKKSKTKKRKRGFGFGGTLDDNNDDGDDDENNEADDDEGQPLYGKEALEALLAEQKLKKTETNVDGTETVPLENIQSTISSPQREEQEEDAFISLDERNNVHNIPGINDDDEPTMEHEESNVSDNPEELAEWEEQIERRAGITGSLTRSSSAIPSKLVPLQDLAQNLQSTIRTIETQQEELQNAINRRDADREHTISDSKMQRKTLEDTGIACEYYQRLRHDLTLWVGALRDLRGKVQPISQAFQDMVQVQCEDVDTEFRSLQDDCIGCLEEMGLLNRILGRQPEIPTKDGVPAVDEFGRDVRSQYLRDRDNRFQKRRQKIDSAALDDSTTAPSCDCIIKSMYEDHDEKQRCETLHLATDAAFQDLDNDYTNPQRLTAVFGGWYSTYANDYDQCYAALSLGDLASLLLQAELCKSSWFPQLLSIQGSENVEANFPVEIHDFFTNQKTTGGGRDDVPVGRAVEKGLLPILLDIMDKSPSANLFLSKKNAQLFSTLVGLARTWIKASSKLSAQLQRAISDSMIDVLNGIAIPIMNDNHQSNNDGESRSTASLAINFAKTHIAQILQEMLCNMIIYWFPLLSLDSAVDNGENGIHFVLNFINDTFLMLLSSLGSGESSLSKEVFSSIWKALSRDSRKLLENPSLLLMTTPLRAARFAYQLDDAQ